MFFKKGCGSSGLPRIKASKGIGRKRLKASQPKCRTTAQPLPNSRTTDEDSGFGGDSFGADLSLDGTPVRHAATGMTRQGDGAPSIINDNNNNHISGKILPRFGASKKIFMDMESDICRKRIRLDMTEEANELPEEEVSLPQYPEGGPKIVSFKNVPGLLLPASAMQVKPATLLSLPPRQPVYQPVNQPKPCVAEQQIKEKPVVLGKVATAKPEKVPKKRAKCHLLEGCLAAVSSDGAYELKLLTQPEGQHRARYQTEGSRGAVKDRAGAGHPSVQLKGYDKATLLQVFVASDAAQGGLVTPHLFYQACKVSGKNSTPCKEERIHGTTVLEILMCPDKDMTISCDCVGILKERNVDVEQRMKSFVTRGKKKSTKCRLVFRTKVTLSSGVQEILQVVSQPISCTQPPGIPEISRKSLSSCNVDGKEELFIIGKNFYKDTEVLFREMSLQGEDVLWSTTVAPEKDYLQSNHLICQIPPYLNASITVEVEVELLVVSCGKISDPHPFTYLPHALKKEVQQNAIQRLPLVKGVSPNAVKLNEMYAESAGTAHSAKEYFLLSSSATQTSPRDLHDSTKDRTFIPPVHVNRVLATVNPQTQASSNPLPKFTYKNFHSNTLTTATMLTPKPSTNSFPSTPLPPVGVPVGIPVLVPEGKKENVLENLIHMLKLLKSIPGNLHTPIVDLVADEIMKQVKKFETNGGIGVPGDMKGASIVPPTSINLPYAYEAKVETAQKLSNPTEGGSISLQSNVCPLDQTNSAPKSYPLNTYQVDCTELPLLQSNISTTVPQTFSIPVAVQQHSELKTVPVVEGTKGMYPVGTSLYTSKEIDQYLNDKSKNTYPVGEFHVTQSGGTSSHCGGNIMQAICHPSPSLVINLREQESHLSKLNFVDALNSPHPGCISAGPNPGPKFDNLNGDQLTNALFHNDYKVLHPMQGLGSTLSDMEIKMERNILQNEDSRSASKLPTLQNGPFVVEVVPPNRTIDPTLVFKMENCDPLLSQANAVSNMALHANRDELPPMTLHAPVGSSLNLHANDGPSLMAPSMGQTGSSEVPISNYSESELLDYINPTCFDNV